MKAKILSVINIKGGVGKTTTVCSLGEIIGLLGKKVLIIDLDPQGNSSQMFGCYKKNDKSIIDIFLCKGSNLNVEFIKDCIFQTEYENIDIIPSKEELTFTSENITYDTSRVQQKILDKALNLIKEDYDYIILDNSPYFNIITMNALCTSDYVLTPVENDGFGYSGLASLLGKIYGVKDELNPSLNFLGVFINKVNKKTNLFKDLYQNYKDEFGDKFIKQYIRLDNKVKESVTEFIPLIHYDGKCRAANDYRNLLASLNILDEESQNELEKIIEKERRV